MREQLRSATAASDAKRSVPVSVSSASSSSVSNLPGYYESITLDAVLQCVARAVHETRQRTRSLKLQPSDRARQQQRSSSSNNNNKNQINLLQNG